MAVSYDLQDFVSDLYIITESELEEGAIVQATVPLLQRLVKNSTCVPPEFRKRGSKGPGRYMLHRAPRFNVTSIVWGPGQGIQPHNHETWGLVGLVENEMRETCYRRIDDGSVPGVSQLEIKGVSTNRPGDVSTLLPPRDDIHALINLTQHDTVEVHVYGKDLAGLKRLRFDLERKSAIEFVSPKYDNC
jgi:predicted metal-dependent enzyme (double-stranded beta helix superfamily)